MPGKQVAQEVGTKCPENESRIEQHVQSTEGNNQGINRLSPGSAVFRSMRIFTPCCGIHHLPWNYVELSVFSTFIPNSRFSGSFLILPFI